MLEVLVLIISITALVFPSTAKPMDISVESSIFILTGEIRKGDFLALKRAILKKGAIPSSVWVGHSPGGDVEEAISIGRFFRKAMVEVTAIEMCNSACFLLWAGGATRAQSNATFGLHRPRYDAAYYSKLSPAEADSKYRRLSENVRSYLLEVDVPTTIIDQMMSKKSTEALFIHGNELVIDVIPDNKGQIGNSPAHEEWIIAKCGGLSPDEEVDYYLIDQSDFLKKNVHQLAEVLTEEQATFYSERMEAFEFLMKDLSAGYIEYLRKKGSEIEKCERSVKREVRATLFSELKKNSP